MEGHSRFGKAALVAMAYDPRVAIGFISSSGEGGAKLHRRDWGEIVENIAGSGEYHWMAGNFIKYAGPLNWNDLPVDSHELIALCAPRPVFVSAGTKDERRRLGRRQGKLFGGRWQRDRFTNCLARRDLGTSEFPPVETTLIDGDVAFRQHSAGPHARTELADVPDVRRAILQQFAGRLRSFGEPQPELESIYDASSGVGVRTSSEAPNRVADLTLPVDKSYQRKANRRQRHGRERDILEGSRAVPDSSSRQS